MPKTHSIKTAPDDDEKHQHKHAERSPTEFLEKARQLGVRTEADGVAMIREDRDRD
jgi:hypothetical protein